MLFTKILIITATPGDVASRILTNEFSNCGGSVISILISSNDTRT